MSDPRYPIGKFSYAGPPTAEQRSRMIEEIELMPAALRAAVQGLSPQQLETPYREGGWTVRQVIHHVPESHMNAYIRFKLALTEDQPAIKPYAEDRWAELPESRTGPLEPSLALTDALHRRWVQMLGAITEPQWKRTYIHPDQGSVSLERSLALYAWHGRHHLGHITSLRQRRGW